MKNKYIDIKLTNEEKEKAKIINEKIANIVIHFYNKGFEAAIDCLQTNKTNAQETIKEFVNEFKDKLHDSIKI